MIVYSREPCEHLAVEGEHDSRAACGSIDAATTRFAMVWPIDVFARDDCSLTTALTRRPRTNRRDQMGRGKEETGGHATDLAEIVVPDSYSGFARLLLYLYTGM